MTAHWQQLEPCLKLGTPSSGEYRDRAKMVFSHKDQKLYFFGVKGVNPTDSNWHETLMTGSHVSVYDVRQKSWSQAELASFDEDAFHREHLFSVGNHVLLLVYSLKDCYRKLLELKDGKFDHEIKIEALWPVKQEPNTSWRAVQFFATEDGFYAAHEDSAGPSRIYRFAVQLDGELDGEVQGATCTHLANLHLHQVFQANAHVTVLAHSADHRRLFVWGGQEACGFRWDPSQVFTADVSSGAAVEMQRTQPLERDFPGYSFAGPHRLLQDGHTLVMLGGSTQVGMCHSKDNPQMWAFDTGSTKYRKLQLDMPAQVSSNRLSHTFDYHNGVVYVADTEKGIYQLELRKLL